jgi:RHS repeat-associated protein
MLLAMSFIAVAPAWSQGASAYKAAYRYDNAHRLVGVIKPDPDGAGPIAFAATRNTYDSRGLLTRVEYGELSAWQLDAVTPANWPGFTIFRQHDFIYDSYGRKLSQQTSSGGVAQTLTQFSYDSVGRLECTVRRMNVAAFAAAHGLSACQIGAEGQVGPDRIERSTYDTSDRTLTRVRGYGTSAQQTFATFTYTAAHMATSRDANGNLSTYSIDGLARLEYLYFPSKTVAGQSSSSDFEKYGYDSNGNRTLLKKRDNTQITIGYDALNRIISKDLPGTSGDVSYSYDQRGLKMTALFSATGLGVTNAYDGFGRMSQSTTNMAGGTRSISYAYDANGNRTRVTYPDGAFFDYAYDGLDRLKRICENEVNCEVSSAPIVSVSYDIQGRRAELARGASVSVTDYGYDDISRLSSITHDLDGGSTGSDISLSFSFNPSSQIRTRTISNSAYAYAPSLASSSYAVNGLNQYTQVNSPSAVSYTSDPNGNLASDGTTTFGYDAENRLTSATGAKNATLAYDPDGRLFQTSGSSTTQFLYDGDRLSGEYDASGTLLRRYVFGTGVDEPLIWYEGASVGAGNRRYLHANHQGSVIAISNSSGTTLEKNTYDPNGVPGEFNTSRFQFTGQAYIPELGLYYFKARFYSPILGRFIQPDPVGYKDDMNLYAYVAGDPLNRNDPLGLWSTPAHNLMIKTAFARTLDKAAIAQIQAGSKWADSGPNQAGARSFMHGMADKSSGQSPAAAKAQGNEYVKNCLAIARELADQGKTEQAQFVFGAAMHSIMDSYSPEHTDENGEPVPWSLSGFFHHGWGDNSWLGDFPGCNECHNDLNREILFRAGVDMLSMYFDTFGDPGRNGTVTVVECTADDPC